ncbi:MAG TPA: DUF6350 family protein [Micromonosporaceae bacterium]|jgi:hypothetical protein
MAASPDHPDGAPRGTSPVEVARASDRVASRPTVRLPLPRRPDDAVERRAPLSVAAGVNALVAAAWSLVPIAAIVAAVTLTGPGRPSVLALFRYSVAAWLVGHGVPVRVAGQPITLIPLAIAALALWRCVCAGRNTARALGTRRAVSVRPAVVVAGSVAIPYGLLGAAGAALARTKGLDVAPLRAGLTLGGFALVAAFLGAWPATGFARRLRTRIPHVVRDGVRTAIVGVTLLLAAGAVAVGVEIAAAGSTATTMLHDLKLNFGGDFGIVLVCLAYAPNLAVWASAYLTGPGFTLTQALGLPVFAGLPERPVAGFAQALLATPLIAGLVSGVLLARRTARDPTRRSGHASGDAAAAHASERTMLALAALVAAPSAAIVLALAGAVAAGALGGEALGHIGQVGWDYAVIGGLGIGIGAAAGAAIAWQFGGTRRAS